MLVCLSFDLDWVPDFIINDLVKILNKYEIPATFFMTNPIGIDLPEYIETAIHPNFLPHSTQGNDEDSVLKYCHEQLPGYSGARTHRLYWHSGLDLKLAHYGCLYDSSLFLPLQPNLRPFTEQKLIRIPFYWGDNFHLRCGFDMNKVKLPSFDSDGIKVFQFHPINIFLNTHDPSYLQKIKKHIHPLHMQSRDRLVQYSQTKRSGIRDFFFTFLEFISSNKVITLTLLDVALNMGNIETAINLQNE